MASAADRIVPAYALTGGRTRATASGRDLPIETPVTTTAEGLRQVVDVQHAKREIILLCRRPTSVAEVAARMGVPIAVARVLVTELATGGCLAVHLPEMNERPDRAVLERLLEGLKRLDVTSVGAR
jgi:Protein of unknown function (DUF742)